MFMRDSNLRVAQRPFSDIALESAWTPVLKLLSLMLCILLLLPKGSIASGSSIILLPPQVESLDESENFLIESALVEGFSANVAVHSGQEVKETIQESFTEIECSVEKCINNLAIKYNSEFIADFSAVKDGDVYLISLKLDNIITSSNVLTRVVSCEQCSTLELVKKAKSLAFNAGEKLKFGSERVGNRSHDDIDRHIKSLDSLMRSY